MRSLAERGALDPDDLIGRHLEWLASEPRRRVPHRPGAQAGRSAPRRGARHRRRPARPGRERAPARRRGAGGGRGRLGGAGSRGGAGNGSVMYCAPLGLAYAHRPAELAVAALLSSLTHHDGAAPHVRPRRDASRWRRSCGVSLRARRRGRAPSRGGPGGEELEFLVEAAGRSRPWTARTRASACSPRVWRSSLSWPAVTPRRAAPDRRARWRRGYERGRRRSAPRRARRRRRSAARMARAAARCDPIRAEAEALVPRPYGRAQG